MSAPTPPVRAKIPRAAFGQLLRNEMRSAIREPRGLILGLVLPLVLLVVFGSFAKFQAPLPALGGLTRFDLYVPILISFALAAIGLWSLPSHLATYREYGILRRLSTTPIPPAWLLAAQLVVNLCIAVVALALLVTLSTAVFGYRAVGGIDSITGFLLATLLSVGALFAMGFVIAAIAPSGTSAYVIGALTFFPLMFFAGLWIPRATMSPVLQDISNYTPLGASVQAVQTSLGGTFPPGWELLVLAGYAVVFGSLAVRVFRWE